MMQGVLTNQRVRLLFSKGMSCFRERRKGSRKRKSIRGCIVGTDLAIMALVIVKKGAAEIDESAFDVLVAGGKRKDGKISKFA